MIDLRTCLFPLSDRFSGRRRWILRIPIFMKWVPRPGDIYNIIPDGGNAYVSKKPRGPGLAKAYSNYEYREG
jgi:hypothetical protein